MLITYSIKKSKRSPSMLVRTTVAKNGNTSRVEICHGTNTYCENVRSALTNCSRAKKPRVYLKYHPEFNTRVWAMRPPVYPMTQTEIDLRRVARAAMAKENKHISRPASSRPKRRGSAPKMCHNPDCKKQVKGHPNKKFCRPKCKDRYHNGIAAEAGYTYSGRPLKGARTPPWVAAGVDEERYRYYANEYGGTPQFDRNGVYVGMLPGPFDNSTDHQNSYPND